MDATYLLSCTRPAHEGGGACIQEVEALGSRTRDVWGMLTAHSRMALPGSSSSPGKRTTVLLHMSVAV